MMRRLSLPALGRRSFFKVGVGAYASLMAGCLSRGRTRSSSTILLKGERDWVASVCTLCPSGCAIRAYSESGRIVAVTGDPDDPNTGGKMCPVGLSVLNPATHLPLRADGAKVNAWWRPVNDQMEQMREAWFDAPDLAAGKKIAEDMQRLAFETVPFIPLGLSFAPTAFRSDLSGFVRTPYPAFWGVKRA